MKMFFLTPSGALALPANRSDSEFAGAGLARILLMLALLLSNWKAYAAFGVSSIAPTSAAEIKISSCGVDVTGTAKDYYNNTLPWGVAGTLNTAIDVATGIGHMPAAIGHLGEGTGRFSADPSWENAPGMFMDVATVAGVMAVGMSPLPSANTPLLRTPIRQTTSPATVSQVTTENLNPFIGAVDRRVFVVNPNGNVIPVETGQSLTGSADGIFLQVHSGSPTLGPVTGMRLDGPHSSVPFNHAHVPGIGNHIPVP